MAGHMDGFASDPPKKYWPMKRADAADYLGLRPSTLACWDGPSLRYYFVGGTEMYDWGDLDKFIAERAKRPPARRVSHKGKVRRVK
jgi:hypothetical protein